MTTSISKFMVASIAPDFSSREIGRTAFAHIRDALSSCEVINLDFGDRLLTPSFADECIGGLAAHLGLEEFKRRVKLSNIDEASKPLVRHVVLRRVQLAA